MWSVLLPAEYLPETADLVSFCDGSESGTTNDDARDAITLLSASFDGNVAVAALTASAPVAAALEGSTITGQLEGFGSGVAGLFRASKAAELSACVWSGNTSDGQYVDFGTYALPGGVWAANVVSEMPGAQELSWEGLERVISVPASGTAPRESATSCTSSTAATGSRSTPAAMRP